MVLAFARMLLVLVVLAGVGAQAQPSEFESCLEVGSYCSEAPLDSMLTHNLGCGRTFYKVTGRVAFPALVNRGPVTISVLTLAPSINARYPLYVEIRGPERPPVDCIAITAGGLVLEAQGFPIQCGGVWVSVGPLDLTQNGVPLGAVYHVQVVGFREFLTGYHSTGLGCIRVTSDPRHPTGVSTATWSAVKGLYAAR